MKSLLAITLASVYGLCLRLLFASADGLYFIMSVTFIFLVPTVVGYLTVIFMPPEMVQSRSAAFWKPWITCLVLLGITIAFSIEGTICWIMIFPIFAFLAGSGGVTAYAQRLKKEQPKQKPNEDNEILDTPDIFQVSLVLLLPLLLGVLEGERTQQKLDFNITQTMTIAAPPSKVWKALLSISPIENHETGYSFSTLLGFPNHLETTLDTLAVGGRRMAKYEKGLVFEEIITKYEPEKLLVLDINTDPTKIPPTVMDEHIVIGGKHLDILEDIYTLDALPNGSTRVTLSSRFFINTPFNWYSSLWAKYLMNDILKNELQIIEKRAKIE
jgi:hypothetical protein